MEASGKGPSDEMVLGAAINGTADALVTYNVTDFRSASEWFGIPIVRPGDILGRVKQ